MLLQFAFENFLSFRDRVVFSMLVAEGSNPPPHTYVEAGGHRVLRAAAIYGANASGKSNFVKAVGFVFELLEKGRRPDEPTGLVPFKLDASAAQRLARFELEFLIEETRYSYGIELMKTTVKSEWLHKTSPAIPEQLVFSRENEQSTGSSTFELGPTFSGDRLQFARFIAQGTRSNQPFLAEARERNLHELNPVIEWLADDLFWAPPQEPVLGLPRMLETSPRFRTFVSDFLVEADTGVHEVTVERTAAPERTASTDAELAASPEEGHFSDAEGTHRLQIRTVRKVTGGGTVTFSPEEESDGTRRLMHLAATSYVGAFDGLSVLDEIDRSLHPLMTRKVVSTFLQRPGRGQLIFTTHDTNLLSADLLPPEAIWFAEKDAAGASRMYSLAEFEPAQLEGLTSTLEQGYLSGRFGAIPFFADRTRLGWAKPGDDDGDE